MKHLNKRRVWLICVCMAGLAAMYVLIKESGIWPREEVPHPFAETHARVRSTYCIVFLLDMEGTLSGECTAASMAEHPIGVSVTNDGGRVHDRWGSSFMLTYRHGTEPVIRIWSVGPNKTDEGGGGDDINNWEPWGRQLRRYLRARTNAQVTNDVWQR